MSINLLYGIYVDEGDLSVNLLLGIYVETQGEAPEPSEFEPHRMHLSTGL